MPSQPPPSTEPAPTAVNQQPQPQIYSAVPPHQMQQISQGPVMGFPGNPPYSFNQMIPYSYITAAELRMRGLNEQFIAQMEEKRPYLQRFIEQHQEMRKRRSIGGAPPQIPQPPRMLTPNSLANAISHPNVIRERPTQEQINNAAMFVQRTRKDYMVRNHVTTGFIDVPEDQLQEFSTVFDNLWRLVIEIDPNMTMYAALASEDLVRKLIDTVMTCQQQRSLLASNPPKYILGLPALKVMTDQVQESITLFNRTLAAINDGKDRGR